MPTPRATKEEVEGETETGWKRETWRETTSEEGRNLQGERKIEALMVRGFRGTLGVSGGEGDEPELERWHSIDLVGFTFSFYLSLSFYISTSPRGYQAFQPIQRRSRRHSVILMARPILLYSKENSQLHKLSSFVHLYFYPNHLLFRNIFEMFSIQKCFIIIFPIIYSGLKFSKYSE